MMPQQYRYHRSKKSVAHLPTWNEALRDWGFRPMMMPRLWAKNYKSGCVVVLSLPVKQKARNDRFVRIAVIPPFAHLPCVEGEQQASLPDAENMRALKLKVRALHHQCYAQYNSR